MHVSFIIPLFNCLPLTQAMLASLRKSVPRDLSHEIIFVDDGSTDGTRGWLRDLEDPRVRVILNPENLGYAASNNRGAAAAAGTLLMLLNNDLVLTPGWLEPMLELHAKLPNPGAIGNVQLTTRTGEIDHTGIFINAKGKPEHDRSGPRWLEKNRQVTAVTGACLLMSRKRWDDLGGFDEGFINGCEDVDLCLRALTRRCENAVALRSVIFHHVSASPGRKNRDEANTRRLTLRWKDELVLNGALSWSRNYVESILNAASAFSAPLVSARVLFHALNLTKSPPAEVLLGMQKAIDRELRRWEHLLGPA